MQDLALRLAERHRATAPPQTLLFGVRVSGVASDDVTNQLLAAHDTMLPDMTAYSENDVANGNFADFEAVQEDVIGPGGLRCDCGFTRAVSQQ